MSGALRLLLVASTLAAAPAAAQCIRVVDIDRDLPHEVDTPLGNHLSYTYDLSVERFTVAASRGAARGTPHGPYTLRACRPLRFAWESEEFVVLTAGCGTFCWTALVLDVAGRSAPQNIERPLAFDTNRSLLAYYARQGAVRIRNLGTGYEQETPTPALCVSPSATCIQDLRITQDSLEYTFERFDPPSAPGKLEPVSVLLDPGLTGK